MLMRCKYSFQTAPYSLVMRLHNLGPNLEHKFNHGIVHLQECANQRGINPAENRGKHLLIVLLARFSLSLELLGECLTHGTSPASSNLGINDD